MVIRILLIHGSVPLTGERNTLIRGRNILTGDGDPTTRDSDRFRRGSVTLMTDSGGPDRSSNALINDTNVPAVEHDTIAGARDVILSAQLRFFASGRTGTLFASGRK